MINYLEARDRLHEDLHILVNSLGLDEMDIKEGVVITNVKVNDMETALNGNVLLTRIICRFFLTSLHFLVVVVVVVVLLLLIRSL